jgi:uncharacterized protein involved in propanediol utilization
MQMSQVGSTGNPGSKRAQQLAQVPGGNAGMGFGSSPAHHGEILQGVFEHEGRLVRGLTTMPCGLYHSYAVFEPSPLPVLTVEPRGKAKAFRAAAATLSALGRSHVGGNLYVSSQMPLSRGFGSSTSDVIASVVAIHDACGHRLESERTARIAVRAEQASDALMFGERTMLFAQREGVVIEEFAGPLPPLEVLGFGTSQDGSGVDTLAMGPAVYGRSEVAEFAELRTMLREAVAAGDPSGVGRVAWASSRVNQRHLAIPGFAELEALVPACGAVGIQVAHSGDIAGLLFDGRDPDVDSLRNRAERKLSDLGVKDIWRFSVGHHK